MKRCVVAGTLVLLSVVAAFAPGAARASLEEGKKAYLAGDYERAFKEFMPLADAGDPQVQNQIAAMYYQGQGVPRDYAKSAEWFRRAAEHGSADAQYLLGKLYYHGQGVEQNLDEAAKWLSEAALAGKTGAQYLLAVLYFHGKGVQKNEMKAFYWAVLASERSSGEEKQAATDLRAQIERSLSARQIESVREMAAQWTPRRR